MKDADRAYIVDLVNVVKSGNPAQELLSQLNDFLKKNQNQDVVSALLKQMYEIMLNDLTNQNPAVFAAAYNAARIIHANLKEGTKIFEDEGINVLQNQMFADLHILTDFPQSKMQNPTNIKRQNLKSYGRDAFEEILKDSCAKDKSLSGRLKVVGDKQITLTPETLKFDGTLINISTPNYSQVPLGSETLPKMAHANLSALPVGQRNNTVTKVQTPGTDNDQKVYAYMEVPTDPMKRDLPTPAELGATDADSQTVTVGYQGATNSTSSTSTPPASEYAELQLRVDPTKSSLSVFPSGSQTEPTPQPQDGLRSKEVPTDTSSKPIAYADFEKAEKKRKSILSKKSELEKELDEVRDQQRSSTTRRDDLAKQRDALNTEKSQMIKELSELNKTIDSYRIQQAASPAMPAATRVTATASTSVTSPATDTTSPTHETIPTRPLPINRSQYQPWAPATQQYAGVPPELGHVAIDIAPESEQPAQTPAPDVVIDIHTTPNVNNISPAATVFTPTQTHVAIDIPPESSDTSTEDTTSTSERSTTNQKYHLSLTDQILTDDIKRTDNLLAQRMIAGSLLANMGLPTSEIDRILDKAFVSNLDSAEFKSLEGARLLKLREIIAGIYKGGTADINSVNKEITNTANIFLTRIGSKKLNNENYVADNFSDLEEIKKESLERGNKMLSDSLDNPGSKDWTDAVLDSITNEITYPKMINDRYFKLTDKNSNNYSFKNRMQLFGGAFGTGAALYVIASLFFPPLAFIGALMLTFAFVGAVMTVLVEGLSKLLTGIVNFTMGILKLASGLVLGIADIVKSPIVAIANLFRSEDKKIEYFAFTRGALSGLDYIQKSILRDPKDPKSLYSEKKPERFLNSRDSLQGKLETVSAGKTTATPTITPAALTVTRPTPTVTATPSPVATTATTSATAPAITPLTDYTTPATATRTAVPAAATTTSTPTSSVASTSRSGSFSAPAALPTNPSPQPSTSPASFSTAASTPDQPPRTSTLNTTQANSAKIIAAAVEQKTKVEAELNANPSAERKTELKKLLEQSDSMIKREQEKLQQANAPLVSVQNGLLRTPVQTYLTSPLGNSAIAGSPLGSSPVLTTPTPSTAERRSTSAVPANYADSSLLLALGRRDALEETIPDYAAISFDGSATTGSHVKPSIPDATDPPVRRPPPVPRSNYGAMPRREDGSGGVVGRP